MPAVSIGVEALAARQALVFARHLAGDGTEHTEYLCEMDAPVAVGKEMRRNLRMASLPVRPPGAVAEVRHGGAPVRVSVRDAGTCPEREALVVSIDAGSYAAADAFLDAARQHCEDLVTAPRRTDTVRRYLYDCGYWERLGDAPRRSPESVFLCDDARRLADDVVHFMTSAETRAKHRRFGVPYKMNVLLHGPPGSGKTSLVEMVAGQLGSDVFVVQFTAKLRDTDLAMALRRVSDHPNPVVVMEDVDCIFSDRKAHDTSRNALTLSGFLNALDGMSRPEGSVVFLTTNDAAALDPAVVRSRRIDRTLRLGEAREEQALGMTRAFFPEMREEDAERFCGEVAGRGCTTAQLHEYLFDTQGSGMPTAAGFFKNIRSRSDAVAADRPSHAMYT